MKLTTERLILHPATDEEMLRIIDGASDEILKQAYTEMRLAAENHPDRRSWYAMWLIERKDGTHVGELCFKGLESDGSSEIGYGILPAFQRKGYATEAVKAAVGWALAEPGTQCVTAETEDDNKASQRVLLKCGFVPTGSRGEEGPLFILQKNINA